MPAVRCDCGFDSRRWQRRDAATFIGALDTWWVMASRDLDIATLDSSLSVVPAQLAEAQQAGAALTAGDPAVPPAELLDLVHRMSHLLSDAGLALAAAGAGPPPQTGRVVQVNASGGGVPKTAVAGGRIEHDGLAGDVQAERTHHGRPFQALCLWSSEVIDALAGEGHPIAPGLAGENLTITGVDWASLRPGARVQVGTALAELSFPAVPCTKQAGWFSDGDFHRIAYERAPERVRWYAWVRQPGDVRPGDDVVVQASSRRTVGS